MPMITHTQDTNGLRLILTTVRFVAAAGNTR